MAHGAWHTKGDGFSRHSFNSDIFRHLPMLFGAKMRPNYKNYEARGLELTCANPLFFATPLYLSFCFFFGPFRFLANPKCQMPEEHWDMINAKWPMPHRQCQMANAKWPMPNGQCQMANDRWQVANARWPMPNGQ